MNPEIYNGGGGGGGGGGGERGISEKTIIFLQGKLYNTCRILCELLERKIFLCYKKERNPLLDVPNGVGAPAPVPPCIHPWLQNLHHQHLKLTCSM